MAKQVIWSSDAQNDRKEILKYWALRNKSNVYSKKLNLLIRKAIKLIALYPKIGHQTDIKDIRARFFELPDYL